MPSLIRSYETVADELCLKHWLTGESSELLRSKSQPRLCVKHFNPEWSPADIKNWIEIASAVSDWLSAASTSKYLRTVPLLEIGERFISREFVSLGTALSDFARYPEAAPKTLELLRQEIANRLPDVSPTLSEVIRRSVLEGSPTTFWDPTKSIFILAEPKIALVEARSWERPSKKS